MMNNRLTIAFALVILFACGGIGCGDGGSDPIGATSPNPAILASQSSHSGPSNRVLWGMWDCFMEPGTGQIQVVPLRGAMFTANVNNLLEAKPGNLLIQDMDFTHFFTEGRLDCTITLKHPFPGLDMYNGFDVWGVFMHNGSAMLQYDSLVYSDGSGHNEAMLLNPDGWTRWFNYTEFDGNGLPLLEYWPGKLSDLPNPTATLNPYKIFADGLDGGEDFYEWITAGSNADDRGIFRAGRINSRRYELKFPLVGGEPVVHYQYAVIATWEPGDPALTGDPNFYDPDDFPTSANCEEAFFIHATTDDSDLYNDGMGASGGTFRADIEVFDWQGGSVGGLGVPNEVESITIEGFFVPGGSHKFSQAELAMVAIPGGVNSSVFQVEIAGCDPQASGEAALWVIVEAAGLNGDTYGQGFPTAYPSGARRAAFLSPSVTVLTAPPSTIELTSPNGGEIWGVGSSYDITWTTTDYTGQIKLEYSKDGFVADTHEIVAATDDDGVFEWVIPDDPSDTVRVRATLFDAPSIYDDSDEDFSIKRIIFVDDSNTSGNEDGTKAHPYNTIQEGVDAAPDEYEVWVDDSGNAYNEQVIMASDTILRSRNWDDTDGSNRAYIDPPDDPNTRSVDFNGVDNAILDGFKIGFGGLIDWSMNTQMLRINGGSNNTVQDCFFTGLTDHWGVYPIIITDASDITIAHCRMADIDKDSVNMACNSFYGVHATNCPNLTLKNNVITNIRPTSDGNSKMIYNFWLENSANMVIKNNLIHHIIPHAPGTAIFIEGFRIRNCANPEVVNNTIDKMDTSDAFFINQCFGYYFDGSNGTSFANNIVTSIYSSGFPPPLDRGIMAISCTVVCDYTDVWDVADAYYGGASPGTGAISADPEYIDPNNEDYDISATSPAQAGDPSFDDWDDSPGDGSRMGCHGGPDGEIVGLLTPE